MTKINNDYELKLLLNPNLNIDEETYIRKFNNSFINNVNNLNLKYKTVETSQMLPVVWFYFHTEQERKDFALALMNRKEIYKFIVFENNGANQETTDGTWEQVKSIDSVVSNDELLEYKVQAPGNYRYRIYKNTNFTYSNSSIDLIAFTHNVWRDND